MPEKKAWSSTAAAAENEFFMNTDNVLGLEYQAYVAKVRAMALGAPKEYFELRRKVLQSVKSEAIRELYKTIFGVLSLGKDKAGNPIGALGSTEEMTPGYPADKINDFAVDVVRDLSNHLDRVVDIILPDDYNKLAEGKTTLKGLGSIIA